GVDTARGFLDRAWSVWSLPRGPQSSTRAASSDTDLTAVDAEYQHLVPEDDASFPFRVVDLERFPFYWHFHPEYELTFICSGRGRRHVADHVGTFGPGDLALIGPELPHSWLSTAQPGASETRSTAIVVQFDADFLGEAFLTRQELRSVSFLLEMARATGLV